MSYDDAYKNEPAYFGEQPTEILSDHYSEIDSSRRVLDIGAGQGRNALYLARKGYSIDAIDPSGEGLRQIDALAKAENLIIDTTVSGFHEFKPAHSPYSAILLFGLIQILSWDEIHELIARINNWTTVGSLLFISAFSTDDPVYADVMKNYQPDGKNSYLLKSRARRTFLEKDEILTLFPNFEPIAHSMGPGPLHKHGDGPEHRHGVIHFVGKKSAE